jgi:hypothetical protein
MNTILRPKNIVTHTLWLCLAILWPINTAANTVESHQLTINNLNVHFQTNGVQITPPENAWYCHLTVTGYGYGPNIQPVSNAKLSVTGHRTEYQYGNLTEWYLNENNSLEQGITLQAPPQPRTATPLTVEMALTTDLFPVLTENHQAIIFKDKAGKTALNYDKLYVFDANHQKMPAHLTLNANTLAIVVDDRQATYPLTIDPMMINGETIIDRMNASAGDSFGKSVSIDGNTAIIGASGTRQAIGAAYVFELIETTWQQTKILIPDDGDWLESFGQSVAIQGDFIVVGSPVHNEIGAAYVYKYINNTWQLETKLTPDDGTIGDEFGDTVAIDQNRIVISAHEHAQGKGAVYIFERLGNSWQQTEKLMVKAPDIGYKFGETFAISSNTIAIHNNHGTGSVHIFTYSNGSWSQQAKLISNNVHGLFGDAISLYENTIAINESIYYEDDEHSGFVYIFERISTEWIEQQKLIANDIKNNDRFGRSLSMRGNTLVIGARRDDDKGEDSGSAYIFKKANNVWSQTAKITATDGTAGDQFGGSISTDGNTIIVGAYHNSDNGTDSGTAYLFNRSDFDNWTQTKITANNDISSGDGLGFSVATSGDNIVIGAPFDDDKDNNSGSAYVFNHIKGNWLQIMKLISDGSGFGFSVAMDQKSIAIGAPSTKQNNSKGVVYVFRQLGNIWSLEQILSGLDGDNFFGASIAISGNTLVIGVAYNQEYLNAIHIFEYLNGTWQQQKIFKFDSDYLLFPISIDENILVVGLPKKNMVYIFERLGTSWSQSPIELRIANLDATAEFGYSVSNSGNTIAIGVPNDGDYGSVYLFERSDKKWLQLAKLFPSDGGKGDKFGQSLSLHRDVLVVGVPYHDEKGEDSGAAYVFRQTLSGWKEQEKITASNPEKGANFSFSISLDDNTVIVGTPNKNIGGKGKSGAAYVYNYSVINAAPELNNDGNMVLPPIDEDVSEDNNPGILISKMIADAGEDRIIDDDTGDFEGIAVIDADNSNGTWQYSLDDEINWLNFGTVTENAARLLASDEKTRIRFVPNLHFNDPAEKTKITFRAWDQSDGRNNGNTANINIINFNEARVKATAPFSFLTETASIMIKPVTDTPMIAPIPEQNIKLGETVNLQITATDPHDTPANLFNFSLSGDLASEAIINTINDKNGQYGKFRWTASERGSFNVIVTVTETNGVPYNLSYSQILNIVVENTPPVLTPIGNKTVMLNDILKFKASATDLEKNRLLEYQLLEAPKGATIHPKSGDFTWTPTETGHFQATIVVIDDGDKTDQETITITVMADPILALIPNQHRIFGEPLFLKANARHPSGDPMLFTLTKGPDGAILDPKTGEFHWNPERAGTYEATITVTEEFTNRSVEQTISIDIERAKTRLRFWLDSPAIFKDSGEVNVTGKLTSYPDVKEHLADLDIHLTIKAPDGSFFLADTTQTQEDGTFTFNQLGNFDQEGPYTFKVSFTGTNNLAAAKTQEDYLQVRALAGHALLIQGRLLDDLDGLKTHNKSLNRVYRRLKARGFEDQNIEYLNYNTDQTKDEIYVDGEPSHANIEAAFQRIRQRMNADPGPLYIIMVDHGGVEGHFYLDEGEQEYISPEDLDGWLSGLEAGLSPLAKQQERVSIIGACYSGSYIPTLSAPGRVIVTSTTETEESYKGPTEPDKVRSGEFFIEALFAEFGKGQSLKTAFETATQYTEILTRIGGGASIHPDFEDASAQHPLLDDDANKKGSNVFWSDNQEGSKAKDIYLGIGPYFNINHLNFDPYHISNPLMILRVTPTRYLGANQSGTQLLAEVNHADKVAGNQIVVTIRAPSVTLSTDGTEHTGQLEMKGLERITLKADSRRKFIGYFNGFTKPGQYEILYFVNDSETGEMALQRSVVYKKPTFENQPPQAFDLLYPEHESKTKTNVIFDWSNAIDPEGAIVTYAFSIATDPHFKQIVYHQEELTFSMTYVDENTIIDEGAAGNRLGLRDDTKYFWRVQAIDDYGNVTHSTPSDFSFKTDNKNVPPRTEFRTVVTDYDAPIQETAIQAVPDEPNTVFKDCQGIICRVLVKTLNRMELMIPGFQAATISPNHSPETTYSHLRRRTPTTTQNPGKVQFAVDNINVEENRGKINFLVERVGGSHGEISVQYATSDGSAIADYDYSPATGELTWKDQETLSKRISLEIQDDQYFDEGDEIFFLKLMEKSPLTPLYKSGESLVGNPNQILITIVDNEEESDILEPINQEKKDDSQSDNSDENQVTEGSDNSDENQVTESSDNSDENQADNKSAETQTDEGPDKNEANGTSNQTNDGLDTEKTDEKSNEVIPEMLDETATPTTGNASSVITFSDDKHKKPQHTPNPSQEGNQTAESSLLKGNLGVCSDDEHQKTQHTPSPRKEGNQTTTPVLKGDLGMCSEVVSPLLRGDLGVCSEVASPLLRGDLGVCKFTTLQFSERTYQATENQGIVKIAVIRANSTVGDVSVNYQAIDATAKTGEDYQLKSGTLSWADGEEGAKAFEISLVQNNSAESNESLMLRLSEVTGHAKLGEISHAIFTIIDDETTGTPLVCPKPEIPSCDKEVAEENLESPENSAIDEVDEKDILVPPENNSFDKDELEEIFCPPEPEIDEPEFSLFSIETQNEIINMVSCDVDSEKIAGCVLEKVTQLQNPKRNISLPDLGDDKAIDRFGKIMENPSHAKFAGGISINLSDYQTQSRLQIDDWRRITGQLIEITGQITVDPIHVGGASKILVVAGYKPPTQSKIQSFYMRNAEKSWLLWDGDMKNLLSFQSVDRLKETHFIKLFTGDSLPNMPGKFQLYFGYRLENGIIIFNGEQQIEVEIE